MGQASAVTASAAAAAADGGGGGGVAGVEEGHANQDQTATKVQAAFRGHQARKRVAAIKEGGQQ